MNAASVNGVLDVTGGSDLGNGAAPWIVSKAEFARLMNVSKAYVTQEGGKGRFGPGLRHDGKIDVVAACQAWGRVAPARPAGVTGPGDLATGGMVTEFQPLDLGGSPEVKAPSDPIDDPLTEARLRSAQLGVERQQLDLAERRGQLVDAATVRQRVEDKARKFRDRIMAVPAEIADACVGAATAAHIEVKMAKALKSAMAELINGG